MSIYKLALITGASSGIGEALAYLLADKGINLILHGRNRENLERVANVARAKVEVEVVIADLAENDGKKIVIDVLYNKQPDLVINNAGFGFYGDAINYEPQEQVRILDVDGVAVLELTLEAAKMMKQNAVRGVILNVSSGAGEIPISPGFAVYSAAKALVNRFSQSLDLELKKFGIRVLVSCPGYVKTNFRQRARGDMGNDAYNSLAMTSDFAAEQIWWQIENLKPFHIFDWKTRYLVLLTKILPKKWVGYVYSKRFSQNK